MFVSGPPGLKNVKPALGFTFRKQQKCARAAVQEAWLLKRNITCGYFNIFCNKFRMTQMQIGSDIFTKVGRKQNIELPKKKKKNTKYLLESIETSKNHIT